MKIEVGRRFKIHGTSDIVTVTDMLPQNDAFIAVRHDVGWNTFTKAGNLRVPSLYDEVRDMTDKEMDEFLSKCIDSVSKDIALYWAKAHALFPQIDDNVLQRNMLKHRRETASEWVENASEWISDALQELYIKYKKEEEK